MLNFLVKLLNGFRPQINLIRFNPWPGTVYRMLDWDSDRDSPIYLTPGPLLLAVRTPARATILAASGS